MKASELATWLEWQMEAGEPAHITGEPGVGKTSIVHQVSAKQKRRVIEMRLSLREPIDLRGVMMPDLKAGVTRYLVPAELPKKGCGRVTLFFDEWLQGTTAMQSSAGQLLNEHRLGDYELPTGNGDDVYICGASNRAKDRAGTNKMPSHIADRWVWGELVPDVGDWCKWAINNGIMTELIAFLRWRGEGTVIDGETKPGLLSAFDPKKDVSPTCRSWTSVSKQMAAAHKLHIPTGIEMQGYAGKVGEGAAVELMGFLSVYRNLPDPQAMLMNPDTCPIPEKPDVLCALSAILAKKASDANMDRVVKIANRMQDEFSVLMITQATMLNPKLSSTRAFIDWAEKHQEALS